MRTQIPSRAPLDVRFHLSYRVDRHTGCWVWTGTHKKNTKNKGGPRPFIIHKGKKHLAYRIAWALFKGCPIPNGKLACHSCDTPLCVNPSHLFLGTFTDNSEDMSRKGRARPRGSSHYVCHV